MLPEKAEAIALGRRLRDKVASARRRGDCDETADALLRLNVLYERETTTDFFPIALKEINRSSAARAAQGAATAERTRRAADEHKRWSVEATRLLRCGSVSSVGEDGELLCAKDLALLVANKIIGDDLAAGRRKRKGDAAPLPVARKPSTIAAKIEKEVSRFLRGAAIGG